MSATEARRTASTDAECIVALILSGWDVSAEGKQRIAELAAGGVDWARVFAISEQRLSLPIVYRNVSEALPASDAAAAAAGLSRKVMAFRQYALKLAAAQVRFEMTCLRPVGCSHVCFKGPSLAARYYRDLGERVSRDIDVLVPKDALRAVVEAALAEGYRAFPDARLAAPVTTPRDIEALTSLCSVVSLVAPDGFHIEVHTDLDKGEGFFPPEVVLANTEDIAFGGGTCRVMRTPLLLNFVCYHATRHTWSHLNWVTDLDAMLSSRETDLDDARTLAEALGMKQMLDACIEMRGLAKAGARPLEAAGRGTALGRALLGLCVENLRGTPETETMLRRSGGLIGLPARDLVDAGHRRRVLRGRILRRLTPDYEEYLSFPLPRRMHWVYYLTKAWGGARNVLWPREADGRDQRRGAGDG